MTIGLPAPSANGSLLHAPRAALRPSAARAATSRPLFRVLSIICLSVRETRTAVPGVPYSAQLGLQKCACDRSVNPLLPVGQGRLVGVRRRDKCEMTKPRRIQEQEAQVAP